MTPSTTRLRRCATSIIALATLTLANITTSHAQNNNTPPSPIDEANPLVGTAPLDKQALIGNAPPPGEPLYSGMTSPAAALPQSSTETAPVNVNIDLSYPTGVATPY